MMPGAAGLLEIFLVVALSSLFSVGGGNGPVAVIQDRWVGKGLLDPALFSWALALGYLSPGPKAGFVSGVGYYMYGVPGALAAVAGVAVPALAGSAAVSYAYRALEPVIRRITLPASFVVAGMIAAAACDMALPMKLSLPEIGAIGAVALLVGLRNLDPVIVVLGAAATGFGWWLLK
jgi:chromate transporter